MSFINKNITTDSSNDLKYIVITPAKDEEDKIGKSILSVVTQTIKPKYYLIVNDGSTDDTQKIIDGYIINHEYISSITLPESEWDIGLHYSHVCIEGFSHAINECDKIGIEYDYIMLLDADTILEPEYVEKILHYFSEDPQHGIISGGIYHYENNHLKLAKTSLNMPMGSGRIWRKKCFIESMGYIYEVCPDSISNLKARNRGWKLKQYTDVIAIEQRQTSTGNGVWNGAVKNGYFHYRLYVPCCSVLATFVSYIFIKKSVVIGIGYVYGYLSSLIDKKKRTTDSEIIEYYKQYNLRYYISKIIRIISGKCKYYDE